MTEKMEVTVEQWMEVQTLLNQIILIMDKTAKVMTEMTDLQESHERRLEELENKLK